MKTHTIRKLKNKCYPKRGISVREWGRTLKELNLKNINDTDND